MSLLYNPLTWWVRRTAWRYGFDIASYPDLGGIMAGYPILIDAGASDGNTRDWVRGFGYTGEIVSFEPIPEMFQRMLHRHPRDLKWYRLNECLSDVRESRQFHVDAVSEFSGLHGSGPAIQVTTCRLDSILPPGDTRPLFLKTDCEGHDLAVVRGMGKHLSRAGHVLMEVATVPRHPHEPDFATVVGEMHKLGFRVEFVLGNIWAPGKRRAAALDVVFKSRWKQF